MCGPAVWPTLYTEHSIPDSKNGLLPARRYASAGLYAQCLQVRVLVVTLCLCLCVALCPVCLSVCHKSEFYQK